MDTKVEVGGSNAASTPMELILFGLGGCTAIDVETILVKMKVPVEHFEVAIDYERSEEHPKVYTRIDLTFHFYGKDLPQERLERAVHLSEEKYCSVSAMLRPTVNITTKVENHNTA
jgi:putative redox protein